MFNVEKIVKIDVCTQNSNNLLFSRTRGFSFPPPGYGDLENSRLILKGTDMPSLPRGTILSVVFYMKTGDRYVVPASVEISLEIQMTMFLLLSKLTMIAERRRFFKVPCGEVCRLTVLQRDGEAYDIEPELDAIIENMNLGGIYLTVIAPFDFQVDDIVTIILPNMLGYKVTFNVKFLRIQYALDGTYIGYGCQFVGVDSKTESVIAKYINHLQRELFLSEKNIPNKRA